MVVRVGHSEQEMKKGYKLLKCEEFARYYVYHVPTVKRTNDWILEKAEVSRNLLESVKARKLSYFGHAMRNNADSLEKQIMQGTTSGCHKRGRPKTAWIDNILQWTGYSLDKILLDTEDRGRRRQHVHGAAKPRNEDG